MKARYVLIALAAAGALLAGTANLQDPPGAPPDTQDEVKKPDRRHPGHRMYVQFIPSKPAFAPGQPVPITLRITNVGDEPFNFMRGGRQRGARDNQFAFNAQLFDKMLPDIGDPINFGGIGSFILVKPGEHTEVSVDLTKWFAFKEPGVYMMRGSYFMEFADPATETYLPIWTDFACAEFMITIANDGDG